MDVVETIMLLLLVTLDLLFFLAINIDDVVVEAFMNTTDNFFSLTSCILSLFLVKQRCLQF